MAESVIILNADTEQAQGSLEDLGDSFKDLGDDTSKAAVKAEGSLGKVEKGSDTARVAVKRLEDSSRKMGMTLNTAANVASAAFNGMNAALGTARAASELFKKSLEGMFNQSEHGKELFEELRIEMGQLVGKFSEALLGTTDVDEAFQKLHTAIQAAGTVIDATISAMTTMKDVFIKFTPQGWLLNEVFQTISATLVGTNADMFDLLGTTENTTEAFEGLAGVTDQYANSVQSIQLRSLGEDLRVVAQDTARLILAQQGIIEETQDWDDNFNRLVASLEAGDTSFERLWRRTTDYGDAAELSTTLTVNFADSLAVMGHNGETAAAGLDAVREAYKDFIRTVEEGADVVIDEPARAPTSGGGPSDEEIALEQMETAQAALDAFKELSIFNTAQMEKDANFERLAAEVSFIEEMRVLKFDAFSEERVAREAEDVADRDRMVAKKTALMELAETERQLNLDRIAGNKAAASAQEAFATQSIDALTAIIAGEEDAGAAFMRLIGQKLTAEGSSAIFKGGIEVAFGNPQGFAGIAAGLAAVAAGAAITAGNAPSTSSATAVGAGAAPPSQAQTQTVDNSSRTEVINNFGGLNTDPRGTARAVSDAMKDADKYGMTSRR